MPARTNAWAMLARCPPDAQPGIGEESNEDKTMAETVQDTLGPFSEHDPWLAGRQKGEEGQAARGAEEYGEHKGGLR